jgi:hypothetical protein
MGISDVNNTRTSSDKGRSYAFIMTGLSPVDDGQPWQHRSGWNLWENAQRIIESMSYAELSYNAFKGALGELELAGILQSVGHVKGRSRNSVAAKMYTVTDRGERWVYDDGGNKFTFTGEGYTADIANEVVPEKAHGLLRGLAKTGKPMGVREGNSEVWKAWRWLRVNGYAKSLLQITDEGREYLRGLDVK